MSDDERRDGDSEPTGPPGPVGPVDPVDEDAAWAAIVAGYGERHSLEDDEDALGESGTPGEPGGPARISVFDQPGFDARLMGRRDPADPASSDPQAAAGETVDDEHFVPPPPPPLPRLSAPRMVAWAGVVGVPLSMLLLGMLGITLVSGTGSLLAVWFLGGFAYLVGTMPRTDEQGWDDGARL